jgi:hypothetical protein
MRAFDVLKASGRTEPYDRSKIEGSLRRAGADAATVHRVLTAAERRFHPGISTQRILAIVMELLGKEESRATSLYDLKEGIRRMGPAGYSFETYVSELLREYGYAVKVRQMIQGRCASHEIDVVAEREDTVPPRSLLVECKYHRSGGTVVDLKETLYTWARLLDINEVEGERRFTAAMLVSNTRLSGDAARFAACRGIEVLAWKMPAGKGLEEMIRGKCLYPVTILRTAAALGADVFSKAGLMLVKDLAALEAPALSARLRLPLARAEALLGEARSIASRSPC